MAAGLKPPISSFLTPALSSSRLRWLWAVICVLVIWLVPGGLVSYVLMETWQSTLNSGQPLLFFLAVQAGFIVFVAAILLVQKLVLQAPLSILWGCGTPFRWELFRQAGLLWLLLLILAAGLEALLFPAHIIWVGWGTHWPVWWLAILWLTPLQVAAEELFFRGLLPRLFWRLGCSPLWALVCAALAFVFVHLPFLNSGSVASWWLAGFYFSFALLAGGLTLRDQGLERVMGWHLAHNLFALLGLSYAGQPLPTPAVFRVVTVDPLWVWVQFLLLSLIGYGILSIYPLKGKPV